MHYNYNILVCVKLVVLRLPYRSTQGGTLQDPKSHDGFKTRNK